MRAVVVKLEADVGIRRERARPPSEKISAADLVLAAGQQFVASAVIVSLQHEEIVRRRFGIDAKPTLPARPLVMRVASVGDRFVSTIEIFSITRK